ncbi:hypothetical protein B0J15DRAFT_562299 [Fusarium solani]|uniref:Uncharacterized protein n=1 Tax=Fusarium solani TaxID=169388 RepID=A0A9P9KCP3_FUSSL|nr:uncharacterized protein B0J15DRAFT_562299 [Fusarium solani]KAH7248189.1 hypothetical protein B0J15DRAFT_562299 [Fusarium solani]
MHDTIRLSADQFRSIYEESFKTWARLYFRVVENSKLPTHVLLVRDVFREHPSLPRNLSLKHDNRGALATGASIWGSAAAACGPGLPSFRQPVHIRVAVREPIPLSISEMGEPKPAYTSCFAQDNDYLAILILAWTYILSARWTEIMPGSCTLAYTENQATYHDDMARCKDEQSPISIHIGNASSEEARWWAAVLAPGQGWQAHMKLEQNTSISPWSIHFQPSPVFVLLHTTDDLPSSHPAASFLDASIYLDNFCTRHNIMDQSHAALASVLLLPSMSGFHTLRLPAPRLQHGWMHKDHHIDKLLTLSCNTRSIRPGTLAAIKHLAGHNPYIIGRMCMERAPRVAFLWLGSLILGLQERLLQDVRFGQIPIDLPSAVWSGTVQSFIQQRVSKPLVTGGYVSRADECRLLFLSQSGHHARVPVCQWKPFGATPFEDVDIEVRAHEGCEDHQLQYKGILWGCEDNQFEFQSSQEADGQNLSDRSLTKAPDAGPVRICFEQLDREREAISENATRNIFGWLRFDGYARHEEDIWKHEWFDMSESDEDDVGEDETTSGASPELSPRIESWLLDVNPSTNDFTAARSLTDQLQYQL